MENIISKIYIITNNDDTFNQIKKKIGTDKIKIIRVNGVTTNDIDDATIDTIATTKCKYLCSNKSVSTWLNHYNLWNNISKSGDNGNILIIEDPGMPVDSFTSMIEEYWKEVPKDWDMIYVGCTGSCDSSIIKDTAIRLFRSRANNDVHIDGKKMVYVMEPGYPLGLYGYMLSKKGLDKLINNKDLAKVETDIDHFLAQNVIINDDFKVYSFTPSLIKYIPDDNKINNHETLKPLTEHLKVSENESLTNLWDTSMYYIRPLDADITYFSFALILTALLTGYATSIKTQRVFLGTITILQLFELAFGHLTKQKAKTLIFELFLMYSAFMIGVKLGSKK